MPLAVFGTRPSVVRVSATVASTSVVEDTARRDDAGGNHVSMVVEAREARGLVQLAHEKIRRSRFVEARHDLETVLRAEPDHVLAMSFYGLCLANLGDIRRGLQFCSQAVDRQPAEVLPQVNLGKVLRLAGNNEAAHRAFVHAWQVDRRHAAPAAELARMGIRRPPVLSFLPRRHWCNRGLGRLRARLARARTRAPKMCR
jgi:Flp pilus assembly protein TadD